MHNFSWNETREWERKTGAEALCSACIYVNQKKYQQRRIDWLYIKSIHFFPPGWSPGFHLFSTVVLPPFLIGIYPNTMIKYKEYYSLTNKKGEFYRRKKSKRIISIQKAKIMHFMNIITWCFVFILVYICQMEKMGSCQMRWAYFMLSCTVHF